ncbi:MAG: DUF4190 domain-containing protein [Leucobacter sp.]
MSGTTTTDPTTTDTASSDTAPDTATGLNTTAVASDRASSDDSPESPGALPYDYAAPVSNDRSSGISIASFVIGLVSIVSSWTFIAPLTGLILGIVALRKKTSERTLAIWGVALNGAMLAITVLIAIIVLLFMGAVGFVTLAETLAI